MKLLWLINITLPAAARAMNLTPSNTGGWLTGQLSQLDKNELDITVLSFSYEVTATQQAVVDDITYIIAPHGDEKAEQAVCQEILTTCTPDLIHIHGTELAHSYAMLEVATCPTVISIQGLVSVYANHYFANLPDALHHVPLWKRLLRRATGLSADFIADGQAWYCVLGAREEKLLRAGKHFIGRTHWDAYHLNAANPTAVYHKCNEILRPTFYEDIHWDYATCKPHSIFVSQANYPIKGFHILLEALTLVKKNYPDVQVTVTGTKPLSNLTSKKEKRFARFLQEYPAYLAQRIHALGLEDQIQYAGHLTGEEMRAQYLAANLYVLSSSIENSPNSLAEAMMMGTPCISSNIGGVSDMLENQTEGFLYPFGDVVALAHHIETMFAAKDGAAQYGRRASEHAHQTHDPISTTKALLEIYQDVLSAET
ncbi:MAG: glycosyltransferase family 4 protein [Faecalibacterium sp.]